MLVSNSRERYTGSVEVSGSIPLISTKKNKKSCKGRLVLFLCRWDRNYVKPTCQWHVAPFLDPANLHQKFKPLGVQLSRTPNTFLGSLSIVGVKFPTKINLVGAGKRYKFFRQCLKRFQSQQTRGLPPVVASLQEGIPQYGMGVSSNPGL